MIQKFNSITSKPNLGLFLIRLFVGIKSLHTGLMICMDGSSGFSNLGSNMSALGVDAIPMVWGVLAALALTIGGLFITIGYAFRVACFSIGLVVLVAAMSTFSGSSIEAWTSLEVGITAGMFALMFMGPGSFSLDKG